MARSRTWAARTRIATTRVEDMQRAEPYAREALEAVAAGKPVAHAVTRPYGCSVKYSS